MCGKELEVPDSFAGKKGKCPFCMEVLDIPAAGERVDVVLEPTGEAGAEAPGEMGQPAGTETGRPSHGPPRADRVAAAGAPGRRLRLSVLLPAGFVIVVAVIVAMILKSRFHVESETAGGVSVALPDAGGPGSQTAPDEGEAQRQPEESPVRAALDRFPDTQRVAAGLPDTVVMYVEIKQPGRLPSRLAALPVWNDKAEASKRCETAYQEAIRLIADKLGQNEGVVAEVLRRARTLHLGFLRLGEFPVVVVSLNEQASRGSLFGDQASLEFSKTTTFNEEDEVAVDEFTGEAGQPLFAGYYNFWAVLGTRSDPVHSTLKRLRTEAPDGLLNGEGFGRALAAREGDANWVYFAPGKAPSFLQGGPIGQLLQIGREQFAQATFDIAGNKITGTIPLGGVIGSLLGGTGTGKTANFAPEGSAAFAGLSPKRLDELWQIILKVVPEGALPAADRDLAKSILPALKPELAVVMPDNVDPDGAALIVSVADSKSVEAVLGAGLTSALIVEYKNFKMFPWSRNVFIAHGQDAMIITRKQATAKRCIDAAADGKNLLSSLGIKDGKDTIAAIRVKALDVVRRWYSGLEGVLQKDAVAMLTARRQEGAIRFTSDANGLGVLAACVSDFAEQRKLEQKRVRAAEIKMAHQKCRENILSVYRAINDFVAADLERLEYPRSIKEVIDGQAMDPALLRCPLDNDPQRVGHGIVSSYEFIFNRVRYRLAATFSTTAIIVWERKPTHNGKHMAAFVTGQVKELTSAELQKAIDEAVESAKKTAPRKVNIPHR